jgi:hypothetical protein
MILIFYLVAHPDPCLYPWVVVVHHLVAVRDDPWVVVVFSGLLAVVAVFFVVRPYTQGNLYLLDIPYHLD